MNFSFRQGHKTKKKVFLKKEDSFISVVLNHTKNKIKFVSIIIRTKTQVCIIVMRHRAGFNMEH